MPLNNLVHFSGEPFHVAHHLELGAAAIQVVTITPRLEIAIPIQIVRQKAQATLQGKQPGRKGQMVDLQRQFLRELKRKAGLPPDHWSDNLEVWRYTTRSIS